MTGGQAGPGGGHISRDSACGLRSQKTHMDRQWVDSAVTLHPKWPPFGSTKATLPSLPKPAPGLLDASTRERVSVCVCVCVSRHGGKGVSGGMNQPLSSATRPLTYRARFSKTQRSTLTLSRISLSLLAFSHCLPHLSHQR